MRHKRPALTALALVLCASLAAPAAPITYDLAFEGTNPGSGSFSWDAETQTFLNFTWDFGGGLTGGLKDSINWTVPSLGGTRGGYLFEVLTGTDTHPTACGISASCSISFTAADLTGYPSVLANFTRNVDTNEGRYFFLGADSQIRSGRVTATRAAVPVPEPATLSLLALGAAGLLVLRQRRKSTL